jgi:hypothetical protein
MTPNGWEMVPVWKSLNNVFKDRANKISEKQTEIDNQNERVFKNKTNQKIFSEVKQFAKKGFRHSYRANEMAIVKSGFKINKIKKNKFNFI